MVPKLLHGRRADQEAAAGSEEFSPFQKATTYGTGGTNVSDGTLFNPLGDYR
jgi:hypothetical protein